MSSRRITLPGDLWWIISRGAGRNGDRARNSERVLSFECEVMLQGCLQTMHDPRPMPECSSSVGSDGKAKRQPGSQ